MLEIKKKSNKVWEHVTSDLGTYIVSKLYIKSNDGVIKIVEQGGSQRGEYHYSNVKVYDIGGSAETFASAELLMKRLEALNYVGFFYDGAIIPSTLISTDTPNMLVLGSDSNLLVEDAPSDGSEYARKDNNWVVSSGGGGAQTKTYIWEISRLTITNDGNWRSFRYNTPKRGAVNLSFNGSAVVPASENEVNSYYISQTERIIDVTITSTRGTVAERNFEFWLGSFPLPDNSFPSSGDSNKVYVDTEIYNVTAINVQNQVLFKPTFNGSIDAIQNDRLWVAFRNLGSGNLDLYDFQITVTTQVQ